MSVFRQHSNFEEHSENEGSELGIGPQRVKNP